MSGILIDGIEELKAEWAAGHTDLIADLRQGTASAVQIAARQIRSETPVKTGELRRRQFPHVRSNSNGATGDIAINAPYASFVNDGTARMSPRNFVPAGVQQGQQVLDNAAEQAVNRLKARIEG